MAAITMPHEPVNYAGQASSFTAEAAINEPYACVKLGTADGTVIQTSDAVGGIGFAKYETGKTFSVGAAAQIPILMLIQVYTSGVVWAVAGAAVTKGAKLKSAAGGQVVDHTTGTAVVGTALTAAAAQHELVAVLVGIGTAV